MRKIVFVLIIIFTSSCSNNDVLHMAKCKYSEFNTECNCDFYEDATISKISVDGKKVTYIVSNYGDPTIRQLEECNVIDKNNWQCQTENFGTVKMLNGVFMQKNFVKIIDEVETVYLCAK